MADNFTFTEGAGTTGAADDVSGVLFAKIKLDLGTDGVSAPALAGAGAVATGVQRITLASDDPAVALLGTIDTDTGVIAGDTTSIDGKITACNTGAVVLTTGSAAIGKLATNTGVDIGDVDVTSIVPGVAATNLGKAEDAGHSSGDVGVMALTVRQDTAAALGGTDADYQPLITDASGRLHIAPLVTGSAAIGKLASNTGVDIGDVDVTSVIAGVGATNLGKARDSALGATDTGVMALAVRDDTLTTLTPADGDYVPLRVGSTGKLHVTDANITACNTGAVVISSGTVTTVSTVTTCSTVTAVTSLDKSVYIDDADWADNTSSHTLVGGVYQSSPHTVTDGDVSPFGVDVNGNIVLGTSDKAIGKLAANTGVDIGDVDVTSIVPGVAATNLGKAEDAGHSSGDVGVAAMTVRANTATSLSGSDNDYQPLITDTNGRLHTLDANSAAIKTAVEIMDDWDATHASAAPADGAQVMGAAYSTALPTDVGADADAARLVTDRYGRLCTGLQPQAAKAILDNADTTTAREIVAAVASRKIYVTSLILSVDTAGNYWLEDGDATAVTGKFYLAANGGVAITFPEGTPLNTVTVNKALNVKGSTAGNVSVTVTYYLAV